MTNKFNVGDKVIFNEANKGIAQEFGFKPNETYEIKNVFPHVSTVQIINENGFEHAFDRARFDLAPSESTEKERLAKLEEEVAELKLIVAQIRKPSTVVEEAPANDTIEFEGKQYKKVDREAREGDVVVLSEKCRYNGFQANGVPHKVVSDKNNKLCIENPYDALVYNKGFNRTPETVDVYELIVEDKPFFVPKPAKTANQLRAEIIEKAKGFVEKYQATLKDGKEREEGNITCREHYYDTDFFIKGNKVTAVVYWLLFGDMRDDIPSHIGRAKCMPGDVFNEHIGKAIALGRALGLDVSEFEQAVQPDEIVLGHAISSTRKNGEYYEYPEVTKVESGKVWGVDSLRGYNSYTPIKEFYTESATRPKIINDTNAQYGGVE